MHTTIVDKYKASIRGTLWRKVRNLHLKIEEYCQCCGRHKELEVHHIIPWHLSHELRVDPSNLITLCRDCHFRFGHHSNWSDHNATIREDCERFNQSTIVRERRSWKI